MIDIACVRHFRGEQVRGEVVGLHQIVEGLAMISQLGVEQPHEEVRIHLEGF